MFDPPGLNYPGLVPQPARDELEAIIGTTFDTFAVQSDTTVENMFCEYVLAIVRTLYRVARNDTPTWSVDDFRTTVDDVINKLIEKSHRQVYYRCEIYIFGGDQASSFSDDSKAPTLDAFRTRLRSALVRSTTWTHYQNLVQQLEPRRLTTAATTRRAAREDVVVPLLDDLDWTATRWALESGVNPSVTLDYLAGTSTPRKVHRQRIRDTLAKALKQPTFQLPD